MSFIKKLSIGLFLAITFFISFTDNSFAQTATSTPFMNPVILINGASEYTVRTGEKIPLFTWNANPLIGVNISDYSYKTTVSLNSSKKCSGIRNRSKALAGNSSSGSYTPTEIASEKRVGCEIEFIYEVKNKKTKQNYISKATLKYVGENVGTNRNQLVLGNIQGVAADAQQTKTNATLFTGTDAYIQINGSLPKSHAANTVYKVVINDDVQEREVDATLIKNSVVVSGKTIESYFLKFVTPGNISLKSGVKVYVKHGNIKSNVQNVRVTCGIVCPGGPVVNPNQTKVSLDLSQTNYPLNQSITFGWQVDNVVVPALLSIKLIDSNNTVIQEKRFKNFSTVRAREAGRNNIPTTGSVAGNYKLKLCIQSSNSNQQVSEPEIDCITKDITLSATPSVPSNFPTAVILIDGKSQYTVQTGERVPVFTWTSTNGVSFKTTTSVNSSNLCKGIVNGSKALAGNSSSGSYTPTEIASEKRVGCVLNFKYEVKNIDGQVASSTAQLIYRSSGPLNPILNNTNNNISLQLPNTSSTSTPPITRPTTPTTSSTPSTSPTTPATSTPSTTNNLIPTLSSLSKTTAKPGERILLTGVNILTSGTNNIDFVRKSDGAKYTYSQSQKGGKTTAIFFSIPTTIQGQALTAGVYTVTLRTIYGTSNSLDLTIETTPAPSASSTIIPIVSQGQSGEGVMFVQYALQQAGFFTEEITGYFGNITKAAVQAFQSANSLDSIGAVGPKTAELLNNLLK